MDKNPFEPTLSAEFEILQDESIDFFILGIKRANELSWQFNPWYHRLPNYLLSLIPQRKSRIIYDEDYVGKERRTVVRIKEFINNAMLPKTVKIALNEKGQPCDTSQSSSSSPDAESKRTSDQSSTRLSTWPALSTTSTSFKSKLTS